VSSVFSKCSFLLSLAALAVFGNALSAQAEAINTSGTASIQVPKKLAEALDPKVDDSQPSAIPSGEPQQLEKEAVPAPGTTKTSASALSQDLAAPAQPTPSSEDTAPESVAQLPVAPGRATQRGSSYVGIAGNIGLGGGSASLGDGNFAIISKIGLTNRFSVRPGAVIGTDPTVLIPLTYDFSFNPVDAFAAPLPIAPYIGAGLTIATGSETDVGPMITAGVDFPLTAQFTATAALNVGFVKDTPVGLLIGVGYNFAGLGF